MFRHWQLIGSGRLPGRPAQRIIDPGPDRDSQASRTWGDCPAAAPRPYDRAAASHGHRAGPQAGLRPRAQPGRPAGHRDIPSHHHSCSDRHRGRPCSTARPARLPLTRTQARRDPGPAARGRRRHGPQGRVAGVPVTVTVRWH
jgi:hypothetical protein